MGRSPPVPAPTRPVPYAALLPWPPHRTAPAASPGARWSQHHLGTPERRGKREVKLYIHTTASMRSRMPLVISDLHLDHLVSLNSRLKMRGKFHGLRAEHVHLDGLGLIHPAGFGDDIHQRLHILPALNVWRRCICLL